MYELAKSAREKMKAKARSLATAPSLDKGQDTTSATWSPAEALNADAKTGMRPISKRAYKKGGKVASGNAVVRADRKPRKAGGRVESDIGVGMANKNMKEANEKRDGVKHVGALKKGGAVKDSGVKNKKALGNIDPSPKRGAAGHYKKGGRTKKDIGGLLTGLDNLRALFAREKKPEPTKVTPITAADLPPEIVPATPASRQNFTRALPAAAQSAINSFGRKKGGKVKKASGGSLPSPEEAIGSEERLKGIKAMPGNASTSAAEVTPTQLRREEGYSEADRKASRKSGGRTGRATGGPALNMMGMKGVGKKIARKGGKTDINIVINAGKGDQKSPMAALLKAGPGMAPPPSMPPGAGAPPPAMPAMPMPGPGAGPMPGPGGFKKGGRVTKAASSYKDMEAGAASGEGRLQKSEIAAKRHGAPARKAGGRISKVAKSYRDMMAGAGSGEGRLQKTDIAKAKMVRGA